MSGAFPAHIVALISNGASVTEPALSGHQVGVCECTSIPVQHGWAEHELIAAQHRHDAVVARLVNELARRDALPVNTVRLAHGLPLLPDPPAPEVVTP